MSADNPRAQHTVTHYTPDVKCYGCTRYFTTYHGMLIHLESGICASGIDLAEINRYAAQCYQWKKYLGKEFRLQLLAGNTKYREESSNEPFQCPTCDRSYPKLSSLFNHIWTPSCDQGLFGSPIGKLKKWLKRNLKRRRVSA